MATNNILERANKVLGAASAVLGRDSHQPPSSLRQLQKDALAEARLLLQEPSRNTKRKILISINLVIGLLLSFHVVLQLATVGHLPDPGRDNVLMPAMIIIMLGSAAHNIALLVKQREGSRRWNVATAWGSVLMIQIMCLSIVHRNPNTATSLLIDQSFSMLTIFLTGLILNRRAAVGWFIIVVISFIIGVKGRGLDFEYHLMTHAEVAQLHALQASSPALFTARLQTVVEEKIFPLPVGLFAIVSLIFTLMTMLATYFETGMIGQVLGAIPSAIDKIEIASKERQALAQENLRMGMELDVAQRIQGFILPRQDELSKCKGLEVVARMEAATEVGGDLYDVLPQPDGSTFFAIGDVTDHGLASGVVMLMSQTAIRTCLEDAKVDLVQSLAHVNSVLYKNVQVRMGDSRNLTLALLHHKDGRVRIAGQHESVIVLRKDSVEAEQIDTADLGICVGMIDDISPMLAETSFDLGPGDLMLLYTDGATEAEEPGAQQYTVERLMESLVRARELPGREIMERLFSDLKGWISTAPMYDDITLVLVRKKG